MNNQQAQGRARGRGRPQEGAQPPRRPGERPQGQLRPGVPTGVGQQGVRPQSWGQPQHPTPPQPQGAYSEQQAPVSLPPRPMSEVEMGRGKATLPRLSDAASTVSGTSSGGPRGGGNGNGANGGSAAGDSARGAMRGRRQVYDIVRTKPESLNTKRGTLGTPVTLQANYFRLLTAPQWHLYQHRVDFAPDIENAIVRKGLIGVHKTSLGGYLFDGTMLFLTRRLPNDITELYSTRKDGEQIRVTVKFVGEVSMMDGTSLQILNLILRRAMEGLHLQLVGRNFFDALAKIDIPEFKLQLWPGYQTSIRQHEQDILLCTEITHKVMRIATVLDIIRDCMREQRDWNVAFQQQIIGQVVLTDYNNKTYRIDDVDFESTPESTFTTRDGDISYVDYYQNRYNLTIRDRRQPMLISRAKEKDLRGGQNELMALVPELCRSTGLTDAMRSNFRLMKAMAEHTRLTPDMRINRLITFNRRLQQTEQSTQVLKDWQMSLDTRLVEFPGRVLKKQTIKFGNNATVLPDDTLDWTRAFRNNSMYTSSDLKNWHIIVPSKALRETEQFCQTLQQAARGMRFTISPPQSIAINDDRPNSYIQAIERVAQNDPQMIMCVVPNISSDRYAAIKKKCCVDRGIPTQVVVQKTLGNRGLMSVATKIAIQMNCKLGYAPWSVEIPLSNLMTIGFDVTHDTRDKSLSYGALVATMDLKQQVRFFSAVSAHKNGEELSNELQTNVGKALRAYREMHNTLPSRILFYRDGVGDGQIHYVKDHEIVQLKAMLEKAYTSAGLQPCQLLYIVVSKRINTRIFANNRNPTPGTVADDVITLPERYDFYLISQHVGQGTVSPTSYNIIHDEWGLEPDKVQMLSYRFCHMYYNWSGTVRVPAMCQYAHKLAFLVGQYIHQAPSNRLEKRLYYL